MKMIFTLLFISLYFINSSSSSTRKL